MSHPSLPLFAAEKDDDVVFVYESRILTPARPDFLRRVTAFDEDSNASFVFNLQEQNKTTDESETQAFLSDRSVIFVPQKIDIINLVSSSRSETETEATPIASKTPDIPMSCISVPDSDEEKIPKATPKKKKKITSKPLVVLERLPDDLFDGDLSKIINIRKNQSLTGFLTQEQELLSYKATINVENLALHGETSTAKRIQRLSLKKESITRKSKRRRQSQIVTSTSDRVAPERKRKTFCTFCEEWVMDIKIHKKQHDVQIFTCEVCGKKYNMKTHLSQHFRRMHPDAIC